MSETLAFLIGLGCGTVLAMVAVCIYDEMVSGR